MNSCYLKKLFNDNDCFNISDGNNELSSHKCFEQILTYIELLDSYAVRSVMLISSPSLDSICLIYAIILSGRTYIPVSRNASIKQINQTILLTQVDIIFAEKIFCNKLNSNQDFERQKIDGFSVYKNMSEKQFSLLPGIVFFTSGTSRLSKPLHYHYHVIFNYLLWCKKTFQISSKDNFLMTTDFSFIASLRPIFLPLLNNCRLFVFNLKEKNQLPQLIATIINQNISIINIIPSLLREILNCAKAQGELSYLTSIKQAFLSGEQVQAEIISQWFSDVSINTKFYNLYGATEYLVPLYNQIDITQTKNEMLSLYFSGNKSKVKINKLENDDITFFFSENISTGYLELSLSRDSFIVEDNIRYVKCADSFQCNGLGFIFQSRQDRVFKRYGYKVSLTAIEVLVHEAFPSMTCAALLDNNHIIMCFKQSDIKGSIEVFKTKVQTLLTANMSPHSYLFIDDFPLTTSGKIDYQLLKKLHHNVNTESIESFFSRFFEDGQVNNNAVISSLGLESIDYIDLSQLMLNKIGKEFDISKINKDFKISDLNKSLQYLTESSISPSITVKLNLNQQSFYAYELNNKNSHYKINYLYYYKLRRGVDLARLSDAIEATIHNNFILRSRLKYINNHYHFVREPHAYHIFLPSCFLKNRKEKDILPAGIHSKRLVQIHIQKRGFHHYLIMAYHHIAIDAWSAANIRNEIFARYENKFHDDSDKFKTEISLLNKINSPEMFDKDMNELIQVFKGIDFHRFNQLSHIFESVNNCQNTCFHLSKSDLLKHSSKKLPNSIPSSSLFLLTLTEALHEISLEKNFLYYISLSNRLQTVPFIKEVIMNMTTSLPMFITWDISNTSLVAQEIKNKLELYFKNMDYNSICNFLKNKYIKEMYSKIYKNECLLVYTFVGKGANQASSDDFIDWENSKAKVFLGSKPIIFLRVYDLGDRFIVNLDTRINKNKHKMLAKSFKNILLN